VIAALACWCLALVILAPAGRRAPGRFGARLEGLAGRSADRFVEAVQRRPDLDEVGMLCAALCSELRAGASPRNALLASLGHGTVAPRARAAAELGEPVGPALLDDARASGRLGLAGIAACWNASADSGAGLAEGLERVAALAAAQREVSADLAAETAGPRATARVLAMLPLIGLLLGELLGAQPVRWLLGTAAGMACLALGCGLLCCGHLWSRRILRAGLPPDRPVGRA